MKKSFLAVAMITLTIGLTFYIFPIEVFQQIEMSRMKWNGVSNVLTKDFHYFEKNNCVEGEKCQCALLLHGLGDFALTWRQMMSKEKIDYVKNVHFFAPNLPGALHTPKLESMEDYNVQALSKKVSNFFLPKCEDWIVVGNSYGGWISVFMALQSEKISGLLLLGTAGLNKDYTHVTEYFLNPTGRGARDFYLKLYAQPKKLPDFIFERIAERAKNQPVLEEMQSIKKEDYLDAHLVNLKVPVQYVWGDSDRVIPVEWATAYRDMTPRSQLKILKECGHVPQKECPEEVVFEFNELLSRIE